MEAATATPDTGAEPVAPIETDAPAPDAPKRDDAPRTQDDKIRDALASVGALEDAPDTLKKPNVNDQERNESGQFKAKEAKAEAEKPAEKGDDAKIDADKPDAKAAKPDAEPKAEAKPAPKIAPPERFNDGAKAEWEAAPEAVRHEVVRMQRELEKGIGDYKAKIAEVEAREAPLKPYREMAEKHGVKFEDALRNYVAAEEALVSNPVQALARMAEQYVPGGFAAFIAQATGQQGQTDPRDAQIHALRQEIAELKQSTQATAQSVEQSKLAQMQAANQALVDQFAAEHPRLDELQEDMTRLLKTGFVPEDLPPQERLSQAYEIAARLKPAPDPQPAPPAAPAQTREPATSISGAPSRGSSPQARAPQSQEEAVDAALRRYGII